MKTELLKYAAGIVVGILIAVIIQSQCTDRTADPVVVRDTLKVAGDSIRITKEVPVRVDHYVVREIPADSFACCTALLEAYATLDSVAADNYVLTNLEVEGEIDQGAVRGTLGWSMPRYIQTGQGFAWDLRTEHQATTVIQELPPTPFWNRFGYGIQAGAGASMTPAGTYPSIYIGVGVHFDLKGAF